jgi:hypothetical protein
MKRPVPKAVLAAILGAALAIGLVGTAFAVSGGGYSPDQQDCTPNSSAWNTTPGYTEPGCHNTAVNVESGGTTDGRANSDNTRYAEVGTNQQPSDDATKSVGFVFNIGEPGSAASPHSGCVSANTDGTGGGDGTGCGDNPNGAGGALSFDYYEFYCPLAAMVGNPCEAATPPQGTTHFTPDTGTGTALDPVLGQGVLVYFGMDDNNDAGEHDGVSGNGYCVSDPSNTDPSTCSNWHSTDGSLNGPSDGGGITVSVTPQHATDTPDQHHPQGAANASIGFCADGVCGEGTTQQQTVYYGCDNSGRTATPDDDCAPGTASSGNVYENNAPADTSEPHTCSSGGVSKATGQPDEECASGQSLDWYRQHTPTNMNAQPGVQTYQDPDPQRSPITSMPGIYAGTCGVFVNGYIVNLC